MIEEGIVKLVQGNSGVTVLAPLGGFMRELPKDQSLPSWTWASISRVPNTTLQSFKGLKMTRLQIDCYGDPNGRGLDAISLARAIDVVLNGFQGTLADADSTFVSSCFTSDTMDFFDESRRSYRRMIEYEILYAQD